MMFFPFQGPYYINLPPDLLAWAGWGVMLISIIVLTYTWRDIYIRWDWHKWVWLGGLILGEFAMTPFFGLYLSSQDSFTKLGGSTLLGEPALMFLSAIPWMVCGGLIGVVPATVLGGISGVLLAILDTHDPFTILEIAGLALLFSLAIRQRYRTITYRFLRHPFFASIALSIFYAPVYLYCLFLATTGTLAERLDFAVSNFPTTLLATAGSLIISGIICEGIFQTSPKLWGSSEPLRYSPSETRLLYRVLFNIAPGIIVLITLLTIGDWIVSVNIARQMIKDRLINIAELSSDGIPYFLETGQNLIQQFSSDPQLSANDINIINQSLEDDLRSTPFFRQLIVIDEKQNILGSYPAGDIGEFSNTPAEKAWVQLGINGVNFQLFSEAPLRGETTAQVVFLASIKSPNGQVSRLLWGRTDLATNPYTASVIKVLMGMRAISGLGQIIDQDGVILYHPDITQVMVTYTGETNNQPGFFENTSPAGLHQLIYYQPIPGVQWAIALTVPSSQIQQMALNIATPALIIVFLIGVIVFGSLYLGLNPVSRSLVSLSNEARLISQGHLDHKLPVSRAVDEVGHLRDSFELMRLSLRARLEELNRLLLVSQGVSSSLEIQDAIRPILDAAFMNKACLARVVLVEDKTLELHSDTPGRFGIGLASNLYSALDEDILNLTQQHETVILSNLTHERVLKRVLNISRDLPHPASLIAVAVRHEARFYGALWVAFDYSRTFSDEEVRFLNTLAGEAAMAAANARLYATAEVGRQRLEAILSSTPEPVLVTDQQNRLLIINPAALQLPDLADLFIQGRPISSIEGQNDLISLLCSSDNQLSQEIAFSNGRVYYATVSSVVVENQFVGKVCILRDITHYKELDALKSEFVSTVSHDLRFPLTLMRGYATMLQMVGDLNDQQKGYVRKVINGVEEMSRLVNNLLDLGRIEAGVGLQLKFVSIKELADNILSMVQLQAAQKEIQLNIDLPTDNLLTLEADPSLLQQAIYNLVENAIRYTPVHGKVQVNVQERLDSVLFTIQDTGIGIAPIDQPRMFEKFYRIGQRDTNQQRGSGLGLAIVKSIADRHNGRVWLESQLGKGSIFYLEIPRNQKDHGKNLL